MICNWCAEAADHNKGRQSSDETEMTHNKCTQCDCQHKPIKTGQIIGQAQQN